MPVVKKVKKTTAKNTSTRPKKPKLDLSLPTEVNEPSDELSDYSILLYGAKKIGKTSLASRFPNALFLSTEPGTKGLRVYQRPVNSWEEMDGYISLLQEGGHPYKTVVVDTIDLVYELAYDHICSKKMISSPTEENDFGATWREIKELFKSAVIRIMSLPTGCIFVSHDEEKEVQLRSGDKIDRVQPTMAKQALRIVEALVDIIANYGYEGDQRVLRIDGAQDIVAGCRLEEHFIRAGGEPREPNDRVVCIPMGKSSQQAYDNFMLAFHNKQASADPTKEPIKQGKGRVSLRKTRSPK